MVGENRQLTGGIMKYLIMAMIMSSCAHNYQLSDLSIAEKSYVKNVKKMDSTLKLSNSRSHKAWKRGVDFVRRYSTLDDKRS